jgi:hypothetical protein
MVLLKAYAPADLPFWFSSGKPEKSILKILLIYSIKQNTKWIHSSFKNQMEFAAASPVAPLNNRDTLLL